MRLSDAVLYITELRNIEARLLPWTLSKGFRASSDAMVL
ncbi:hypothetical protein RSAG8_02564, partial [Rhizoctonia solani AG-8 WAC10335]